MKILLTIILLTFSFSVKAENYTDPIDKVKANFWKASKTTPDSDKAFIKANTVYCSTIAKFDKLKKAIDNGYTFTTTTIVTFGCNYIDSPTFGIPAKQQGDYFYLVYKMPRTDNVGLGWFYAGHLSPLSQQKRNI